MTLIAKAETPQTEQLRRTVARPVDLEAASFEFAEEVKSMRLWQRIRLINELTAVVDHAESPAAKAVALGDGLRRPKDPADHQTGALMQVIFSPWASKDVAVVCD
ncbi:MAG TPA: hypothetical protein VGF80_01120 [Galbitalea sp.]